MKTLIMFTFYILIVISITSCDAMLILEYRVKNSTNETIKLKVNNYPVERGFYGKTTDTIIELKPHKFLTVGWNQGIGFPWETKKLYKQSPGVHNFSVSENTKMLIDTTEKNWTYRHRTSTFKIRN